MRRAYLGLKLGNPNVASPIYANFFAGEAVSLIWSRLGTRRGD